MKHSCDQCGTPKPKYVFECPRCGAHPTLPSHERLLFDVLPTTSHASSARPTLTHEFPPEEKRPLWVDYENRPGPTAPLAPEVQGLIQPSEGRGLVELSSFWPIVSLLLFESLLMYGLNAGIAVAASELLATPIDLLYRGDWRWLLYGLHLVCSWASILAPIIWIRQTPLMASHYLYVPLKHLGQQVMFSLFHGLSLGLLPLTYIFMLIDRDHRTPTEAWLELPTLQSKRRLGTY